MLHVGGELRVCDVGKALFHQLRHHTAQIRDLEVLALFNHVFPVDDGGHGGRIGGGTADPLLFHSADEGGVGIVGGGLGKVLVALEFLQRQRFPFPQSGQGRFLFLFVLVFALFVNGGVARKFQARRGGAENMDPRRNVNGHTVIHGVFHLAGQKAAPDQLVQSVLLPREVALHLLRRQRHVAGSNGFMGILRVGLGFVVPGLGGVVILAVPSKNKVLGGSQRLLADAQGVGSHIGNQTHGPLPRDVHAFIELLGDGHGAPGGHAQLPGRVLLEGGGGERWRGAALLVGPLHGLDSEGLILRLLHNGFHLFGGFQLCLFPISPVVVGGKFRPFHVVAPEKRVQRPVFLRRERFDLSLAVIHHAGGNRLHASGGKAPPDLFPKKRTELIAHNSIQNAPGLLGVHQILVDVPWLLNGLLHHLFRDLVKGHAVGLAVRKV